MSEPTTKAGRRLAAHGYLDGATGDDLVADILEVERDARNDALDAVAAAVEGLRGRPGLMEGVEWEYVGRAAVLDVINAARPK